jgi:acetyl-CoA acyltransferase
MGITAELVAERHGVSRADQDALAAESHRRAAAAQAAGRFAEELVPVEVETAALVDGKLRKGTEALAADEGIRGDTTAEALAGLKPAFKVGGTVTAGNASQMTDGAAAALVVSEAFLARTGLKPLGRFASYAVTGVPPELMGIGPVEAIPVALRRAGVARNQVAAFVLNEAFAAQALAVMRDLSLPEEITNPNGSGISLGHPIGATGAILTVKALHELDRIDGRYALVTMCIGGGQGIAAVFERLS